MILVHQLQHLVRQEPILLAHHKHLHQIVFLAQLVITVLSEVLIPLLAQVVIFVLPTVRHLQIAPLVVILLLPVISNKQIVLFVPLVRTV